MLEKKHLLLLLSVLLFMNKNECQNSFNATAPGQLDRTFGTDGRVISTNFNGVLTGIAIRQTIPDDYAIVTTGFAFSTLTYTPLVTYNSNGNQIAKVDFSSTIPPTIGEAIAIDSLNRIVIGGDVGRDTGTTRSSFMARRYINPTTVDTSFNAPTGTAIASYGPIATNSFKTTSIAIDNQNRVLLGGIFLSRSGGPLYRYDDRFKLVRFNNNGQLDSTFGGPNATNPGFSQGSISFQTTTSTIKGIALQENGAIIVSGQSGGRFVLARYTANGFFDTTWPTGPNGGIVTDFTPLGLVNRGARANAVALQQDGKIVAVGTTTNATETGIAFVLARYNPNGTLDTTFGRAGVQVAPFNSNVSVATAVAIDDNGFIIVAGYTTPTGSSHQCFAVAAFNPDGSLSSEFGTNGLVVTSFGNNQRANAYSIAIDPFNRNIIVGGTTWVNASTQHFCLARYNAVQKEPFPLPVARFLSNGTLDPFFGK
ncbi:MAG: hypothetical protein NT124_00525 [Candidatus Dependentiae bacterium]|nr:hypothetical protein [Candidatus Dependentiae bacterium]